MNRKKVVGGKNGAIISKGSSVPLIMTSYLNYSEPFLHSACFLFNCFLAMYRQENNLEVEQDPGP